MCCGLVRLVFYHLRDELFFLVQGGQRVIEFVARHEPRHHENESGEAHLQIDETADLVGRRLQART